jgi:3-dehydroquinate dehydratase-1
MKKELFNKDKLPYICTPLTGKTTDEIMTELTNIIPKKPDLIEWRVDFYNGVHEMDRVLTTAQKISSNSNGIPILFTMRSHKEGGEKTPLSEDERVELLSEICKSDFIDMIDYEMSNQPKHIRYLREVSKEYQKKLILSYHNFKCTPEKSEILKQLLVADFYGADVAKAAVMPTEHKDVLTLLEVTREANEIVNIPIITMSMGALGSVTRMSGWIYGSAVTFAVGKNSSAPGQIPIEDLRKVIEITKKSMGY